MGHLFDMVLCNPRVARFEQPAHVVAAEARMYLLEFFDFLTECLCSVDVEKCFGISDKFRDFQNRGYGEEVRNMSYVLMDIEMNLSKLTIKDIEKKEGKKRA